VRIDDRVVDERMTIGEFASRCGLSAKVLRSYADVGLLVPTTVDAKTGYRYYEAGQLREAEIIRLLRRAGVPLAEIGRFLKEASVRTSTGGSAASPPRS
jgi:DNA-binding transcriptional MerR regulator